MQLLFSVIVVLLLPASGWFIATRHGEERALRVRVFLIALGVRIVTATGVSIYLAATSQLSLFPDEIGFVRGASEYYEKYQYLGFTKFLDGVFFFTGPSSWVPRWINVGAGALLALLIYEIARRVVGRRTALVAGIAVALWPSLTAWSSLVLKDPLVLLGLAAVILSALRALDDHRDAVAWAAIGAATVVWLRPYAYVLVSIALVLMVVVRAVGRREIGAALVATVLGVGAVGFVGGYLPFGIDVVAESLGIEVVAQTRSEGGVGRSGFADPETENFGDVVEGIPEGFIYSLFGPFPWQAGPLPAKLLLVAELPLWYAALALGIMGGRKQGRRLLFEWGPIVTFGAGVVLVLSIYAANAGTAIRQRAMLVIPVVLLAASSTKLDGLVPRWLLAPDRREPIPTDHRHQRD